MLLKILHFSSFAVEQGGKWCKLMLSLICYNGWPFKIVQNYLQYFSSILLESKSNRTFQISDTLHLKAQKKFDGSAGFIAIFWMDIFKVMAFEMGDTIEDSWE